MSLMWLGWMGGVGRHRVGYSMCGHSGHETQVNKNVGMSSECEGRGLTIAISCACHLRNTSCGARQGGPSNHALMQ